MDGWVEGIRCGNGHCSLVAKGHGLCLWLQDWILYMELHNEYLNQLDQNSWKQPSPTRSIEAVVQRDESSSVSCLVPSLLHVLITYYGLQKIIFGERISEWFSCRNRIWQHAQSAFKTDIQKKTGTELVDVVIALLHHASYMWASAWIWSITWLCLQGKHLTGPAVPSPELLITYCGVSFEANSSVNYDNKPMQARSKRTLQRRCWNMLCSQKCWHYCASLSWLRTFCKNWFPTSQTCISPP